MANIDLATITAGDGSQGFVLQGELAGDNSGVSVASAGDVNGDGFDDLIVGAFGADGPADGRNNAGDSYVIFGKASGFAATIDLATITAGDGSQGFVLQGELAFDNSGFSVASAGDVNGDGFDDLIVGARFADGPADGRSYAGDSYVVFGKASGFAATIDLAAITAGDGSQGFVLQGELASDYSGWSVASAGDVNGDGFDDLIVGARFADGPADGRPLAGDSYVIFGKAGGFTATVDLAAITAGDGSQGFVLQGELANDRSGWSVSSAGDINGDGFGDLIVGAYLADGPANGRPSAGDSYVIFGKAGGFTATVDLAAITAGNGSQGFVLQGELAGDNSGRSVASAGDVNGDGFDDLIVGARDADGPADGRDGAGDSYVIFGKAGGFAATIDLAAITAGDGSQGFVLQGELASDYSGWSVASAGDVNGDGFGDLIVGAFFADGPADGRLEAGDSYVIFGKASGFAATIDLAAITAGNGSQGFVLQGELATDFSGYSVASAGDVNGDGFDDLIVGAPAADGPADGRSAAGDSYVIFGSATIGGSPNQVTHAGTAAGETLTGTAAANVMVGGRGNDILLGNGGTDSLRGAEGDDTLSIADAGFFRIAGGTGNDVMAFSGAITLVDNDFRRVEGIESIRLGNGATSLTLGANAAHAIDGLASNAFQIAIDGSLTTNAAVTINGSALTRGLTINLGNDTVAVSLTGGSGNDSFTGGSGNDIFTGGVGADTLNGGAGTGDTASYASSSAGVTVNLATNVNVGGDAAGDSLSGIENLIGSGQADTLTGGGNANILDGGAGNDAMIGGLGNDIYIVDSASDTVTEALNEGTDEVRTALASFSIAALANVENLTGTAGAGQTLTGNGGVNIITGGAGNDTLDGGGGDDTLNGGGGNDTIDGGTGADRAVFAGLRSAYTLTALSGNGVQVVGPDGTDTLSNIENLVFDDTTIIWPIVVPVTEVTIARPVDFNADGIDDLLWRGADNSLSAWVAGAKITIGSVAPSTQSEGTGDFNADGRGDILFQTADRHVITWLMNGSQIASISDLGSTSPSWHIAGTGDFNGNGADDLLWRNDGGQVATWQLNAGQLSSIQVVGSATLSWHIAPTGDFNGDGRDDLLWRNNDGQVAAWLMNANGQPGTISTVGSASASWHIAATGDFNADGRADILFRHDNGQVAAWLMNANGQLGSIATVGSAPASWHIAGTGDLNGNGTDDIIFQNDNGQVAGWLMNGGNLAAIQDLGTTPPTTHIVGSHFDIV